MKLRNYSPNERLMLDYRMYQGCILIENEMKQQGCENKKILTNLAKFRLDFKKELYQAKWRPDFKGKVENVNLPDYKKYIPAKKENAK